MTPGDDAGSDCYGSPNQSMSDDDDLSRSSGLHAAAVR